MPHGSLGVLQKFNFNLGNRSLTAEEVTVVENAKRLFRDSFERHSPGRILEGSAIFKATSSATAAPSVSRPLGSDVIAGELSPAVRGSDIVSTGTASWSTNKTAPPNRKY